MFLSVFFTARGRDVLLYAQRAPSTSLPPPSDGALRAEDGVVGVQGGGAELPSPGVREVPDLRPRRAPRAVRHAAYLGARGVTPCLHDCHNRRMHGTIAVSTLKFYTLQKYDSFVNSEFSKVHERVSSKHCKNRLVRGREAKPAQTAFAPRKCPSESKVLLQKPGAPPASRAGSRACGAPSRLPAPPAPCCAPVALRGN